MTANVHSVETYSVILNTTKAVQSVRWQLNTLHRPIALLESMISSALFTADIKCGYVLETKSPDDSEYRLHISSFQSYAIPSTFDRLL